MFYTAEFYGELRGAMTDRAVLCMTAAATPGQLTEVSADYLASVRATILEHFPGVLVGWGNPAHVLAATPTRHWLEYMDWGQDLLADPLVPVQGFTTPRDQPGTGVEWNEPAIARCLVNA